MQQLTGLDAAFLALETSSVHGHVGTVCLLDPSAAPEPLTLERLQRVLAGRLHLVPPFRRRLVAVPLGVDQPYWVEDPAFDIGFHVRESALPAPGGDRELAELVGRLHSRPLDRSRPLWELHLVSGLSGGRLAVYAKVHHAAIDGVSGAEVLAAVLDLDPAGRDLGEPPPWSGEPLPGAVPLLARSALSLAGHPLRAARLGTRLLRSLPALAAASSGAASRGLPGPDLRDPATWWGPAAWWSPAAWDPAAWERAWGLADPGAVLEQTPQRAPRTPFNRPVSPHRRWASCTVSLSQVKQVKRAAGCTVNDVVMALTAGALRRWLVEHRALPEAPLVAAVPVSVRTEDQKGTGGNRLSTMTAPLGTHLADPRARLEHAARSMRAAKEQHGALPADLLADVTQFAAPALAGQAARLAARLRLVERLGPFNLVVSNVPGPDVPLYYAGARLLAYYPVGAVADGQGLNVTVLSYEDGMHFGLVACRELVPDVDRLAGWLADELTDLRAALGLTPA